jgi:hypothetical protein
VSLTGASGNGAGEVRVDVPLNNGPARAGTVLIAGQPLTLSQTSGCTYVVTPTSRDIGSGGGTSAASIATPPACPWTASSNSSWITIDSASGTGPAQVGFTVAPNQAPARAGSLTVAGQAIAVTQASPCAWVMAPVSHAFTAEGGNGNVLVVVTGACSWTAKSEVDWITMTAGATGTGNGLVQFFASPNQGRARTGSITIAGQRYEVSEAGR